MTKSGLSLPHVWGLTPALRRGMDLTSRRSRASSSVLDTGRAPQHACKLREGGTVVVCNVDLNEFGYFLFKMSREHSTNAPRRINATRSTWHDQDLRCAGSIESDCSERDSFGPIKTSHSHDARRVYKSCQVFLRRSFKGSFKKCLQSGCCPRSWGCPSERDEKTPWGIASWEEPMTTPEAEYHVQTWWGGIGVLTVAGLDTSANTVFLFVCFLWVDNWEAESQQSPLSDYLWK